jgi:hypothetical protein
VDVKVVNDLGYGGGSGGGGRVEEDERWEWNKRINHVLLSSQTYACF